MGITAIFGGTFNPFHIGHYEMLSSLCELDYVDEVFIMPDKIPPHKVCDYMAEDEERIEMCRIAMQDFGKAKLCLIEFERDGKSYSYDTVKLLKAKFPNKKFAFVCGGDMLAFLDKWYKYELLIREIPFICFKRSDITDKEFYRKVDFLKNMGADITVIEKEITAVSSTQIRADFEKNKELLPEKIYDYIKDRSIYCEN